MRFWSTDAARKLGIAARARFQPAVDQRQRQPVDDIAFVIGDRVVDLVPRAQDCGVEHALGRSGSTTTAVSSTGTFVDVLCSAPPGGANRFTEIGLSGLFANALPIAEPFGDFADTSAAGSASPATTTTVLSGRYHLSWNALMLSAVAAFSTSALPIGERSASGWPLKNARARRIDHARFGALPLAHFGQHDRHFGLHALRRKDRPRQSCPTAA